MANQFLGLSLFIMLLSFFIILNAISSFEVVKSEPVLNSLTMAFSNRDTTDPTPPGEKLIKSSTQQLGSSLDKIQALFSSQITAAEAKQNRLGTIMHIKVPFSDFQRAMISSITVPSAPVAPSPRSITRRPVNMLPLLVSLLETQQEVTYKMDMIINTAEEPSILSVNDPRKFSALNTSVSVIAERLNDAGLPKHQVTAGIKKGDEGFIELVFRRYEPFNPLGPQIEDAESKSQGTAP